ncbi:MAG: substrate-binding domain-containing protein [Acidobacteriota bacterium]|nr:substrate-binding domain-containing protein [Acidobacteriota bacterium]
MRAKQSFIPVGLFLILGGCGAPPHAANEKYYLIATNIKVPYWQTAFAGLGKAANQMGVKVEMTGPDTYDPKAQQTEFRRVANLKPAGILLSAGDPKLMQPEVNQAIEKGVPVITIDSDADESKRLLFVGTDNYKAGTIGGERLAKELNGKGNVVVFTMPEQMNLYQRLHGYQDALAAHPQIKLVRVVDIKGDPRIAFDLAGTILEQGSGKVDAFVCLEALACPEVAEVLDRNHVLHKVVMAMDTDPRTLEGIQKGTITATIGQKPFTMAFYGLKMLDDLHHHPLTPLDGNWGRKPFSQIPQFVDTGATLIDKSNAEGFLKARDAETKQ